MNRDHTTTMLEADLAAYALDALEPDELAELEAQLDMNSALRARAAVLRKTAALLPFSLEQHQPRPAVRQALHQRIASAQPQPIPFPTVPRRPKPQRRVSFLLLAASLAAIFALILATVSLIQLNTVLEQQRAVAQMQTSQRELQAILADPNTAVVRLAGAGTADGNMLMNPTHQTGVLVVRGLPALPPDQTYQFWLVRDNQEFSGGTFSVGADGQAALIVHMPNALASYQKMGISIEKRGGVEHPTSEMLLLSKD